MTILTAQIARPSAGSVPVEVQPVTLVRVLRGEWIKMRSLRSTTLTLLAGVGTLAVAGWLVGWATNHYWSTKRPDELASFNPIDTSLAGYNLAQLAVVVLGVLLVTGEYATGMIRATLAAVPQRLPVLWAKTAVYAGVTFVLMLAAAFAAFLGSQRLMGTHGTTLSAPGAVQSLFGVAGYLTLIGAFAVALGFIIRSTAGGIATAFGLLMVLPGIGLLLPSSWQHHVLPYLPSNAGSSITSTHVALGNLSPIAGLVVLLAWVGGALACAAVLLKRRDA
jgi:ABC-2 type transport system permease protein